MLARCLPPQQRCVAELHSALDIFANPKGISSQSPGLRGTSYPGSDRPPIYYPNGVAAILLVVVHPRGPQPFQGCDWLLVSQGSSCLATLGSGAKSLWD